jgi:hypothetical protein
VSREPGTHLHSDALGSLAPSFSQRTTWQRVRAWLVLGGVALASVLLGLLGWAALTPVESPSREEVFEIPQGTWTRRMAGQNVEILPNEIRLTLGVRDVLLLKNHDDVPQIFGPTLMMPGQSFRLPFTTASVNQFACTGHASGQMTITVEPYPDTPWARLRWRFLEAKNQLRTRLHTSRHGDIAEPVSVGEIGRE